MSFTSTATHLKLLLLSFILLLSSNTPGFAAFPLKQPVQENNVATYKTTALPRRYNNTHQEDMGVFGILALIFGATGLFPLAIAAGIIGTQNGRKFRMLAYIGFVLGLLGLFVFVCWLFYRFVIIA